MRTKDSRYRFLLEKASVRGVLVYLDDTWQEILARTDYPHSVRDVLGHAMVAMPLLASTIKFSGKMTLQARGSGPLNLLVVQASADGGQRGLARWKWEPQPNVPLREVFGDANISIQIETGKRGEVYQGIVDTRGSSLQEALAGYFENSEQLPTRLWLMCNERSACGLLLQQLPGDSQGFGGDAFEPGSFDPDLLEKTSAGTPGAVEIDDVGHENFDADSARADDWRRVVYLTDTLTADELFTCETAELLKRLYGERDFVRLFDPEPLRFECGCSRERTAGLIAGIGRAEAESIVQEQGSIEIVCEFCNSKNLFDPVDVENIFQAGDLSADSSRTLH